MRFYDTSSLLLELGDAFGREPFAISNITLMELEKIKTDRLKDWQTKYNARKLLHLLDTNRADYILIRFKESMLEAEPFNDGYEVNNDLRILACAYNLKTTWKEEDGITFITDDLNLRLLAEDIGLLTGIAEPKKDRYTGYKEVWLDDNELNDLWCDRSANYCNCLVNEYLIVHSKDHPEDRPEIVCWTGQTYRNLSYSTLKSEFMKEEVKAMSGDIYQQMFIDSLLHNQMTLTSSIAGSGKTLLSLAFLFSEMDKGNIDRIAIFCNPVASKDAQELGFYKGDRLEKLLDASVGRILTDKITGGREQVEYLLRSGKLDLIPLVDARGCDLSKGKVGVYAMEAQNMTVELMRLLLQRTGKNCKVILDGDKRQIDAPAYAGDNNGMRRVSEVFRGEKCYGQVELKICHRSEIANIAEKM